MPYAGEIIYKQNKYIKLFQTAGAIDKEQAIPLAEINVKRDSIFDKMLAIGLFSECTPGLFYMNTDIAKKLMENRSGFHLWRLEKE